MSHDIIIRDLLSVKGEIYFHFMPSGKAIGHLLFTFFFFVAGTTCGLMDAKYLYYDKSSPVRYGSKTKILRYLRNELKMGNISRKQFTESVKGVIALAKEIDLGTHFQFFINFSMALLNKFQI